MPLEVFVRGALCVVWPIPISASAVIRNGKAPGSVDQNEWGLRLN